MQTEPTFPVQITFHGVPHSRDVEQAAREHVAHLTRFHPRIHGARVVIGKAEGHAKHGAFHVQIRVAIPGDDVVVGHHPAKDDHDDPMRALTDAFRAVERKLEDRTNVREGKVKTHHAEGQEEE